jgi:hypothetical protein
MTVLNGSTIQNEINGVKNDAKIKIFCCFLNKFYSTFIWTSTLEIDAKRLERTFQPLTVLI